MRQKFRIVVFGESYTAGDGVSNGKRYTDLLESQLADSEVFNFGLPGSSPDQQYLVYQVFACGIEYDLLIITTQVSSIWRLGPEHYTLGSDDGRVVRRPKAYFRLIDGALQLENQPVPREVLPVDPSLLDNQGGPLKRLIRKLQQRWPELHCKMMWLRGIRSPAEYDDAEDPSWQLMNAILSSWIRTVPAPVILCPIPTFGHVYKCLPADGYLRRFAELGAEAHAEVVDVLPAFWKLSAVDRRKCRFPVDDHPTELGHEITARGLYPQVRKYHERWRAKLREATAAASGS